MKHNKFYKSKLSKKISIRLSLVLVMTIFYIVIYTSNGILELKRSNIKNMSEMMLNSYSESSENIFFNAYNSAEVIGHYLENVGTLKIVDETDIQAVVEPVLKAHTNFKGIFVLLKDGDQTLNPYWFYDGNNIGYEHVDDFDDPKYWYDDIYIKQKMIDPEFYTVDGKEIMLTTLTMPIMKNSKVVGIVGIDLSLSFFENIVKGFEFEKDMLYCIVSKDLTIVAHHDVALIGTKLNVDINHLSEEHLINTINQSYTYKNLMTSVVPYKIGEEQNMGYIFVSVPYRYINEDMVTRGIHILTIALLAFTVLVVINGQVVRRTLKPIQEIVDVMKGASDGCLSLRTSIQTEDEMENIGSGLNELLTTLESQRLKLLDEIDINQNLNIELEELIKENDQIYFDTIQTLVHTIEAKDFYTAGHCDRVTSYACAVGEKLNFSPSEMNALTYGSILHDIGKIGISEKILNKTEKLENEEYEQVKEHPSKGVEIIRDVHFLVEAQDIIKHHHERYDGKGYPSGLKGENIDLKARIVAVCDAYDAMTSTRSYRAAMSKESAIEQLLMNKGTQFDPQIVDIFVAFLNQS